MAINQKGSCIANDRIILRVVIGNLLNSSNHAIKTL